MSALIRRVADLAEQASLWGVADSENTAIGTLTVEQRVLLRPYQTKAVEDIREAFRSGALAVLFQLATAGGKTPIFSAAAVAALARGRRTVVLVHRVELLKQAVRKLADVGVEAGVIAAGWPSHPERPVQVAMVQTFVHRLGKVEPFQFIVIDECHHCRATTYERIVEAWPKAWVLGVSATPCRGDGRGLGKEAGGIFDALVCGPTIKELIGLGHLAPVRTFVPANAITSTDLSEVGTKRGDYESDALGRAVDRADITGDAVEEYRTRADHKPGVAFCYSVQHAKNVAETFRAAGYRAAAVYGDMPAKERDLILSGLADGRIEVVTSCDLISEGLDIPSVSIVILLRPTKSIVTFLQQIGRGMRPAPGKTLVVVDLAGNSLRLGRPTADRKWSLDGAPKTDEKVKLSEDGEALPDVDLEGTGKELTEDETGELIEYDDEIEMRLILGMSNRELCSAPRTREQLQAYAKNRGYHPGWVRHRLREQAEGALV